MIDTNFEIERKFVYNLVKTSILMDRLEQGIQLEHGKLSTEKVLHS